MLPLVILDLDGTIIGKSSQVEAPVWEAVEKAKSKGMLFAVCTGRPAFGVAKKVAEQLGSMHAHVFQNGAHITYPTGDSLKVSALKSSATSELINYARSKSLVLELYTPTNLFVERSTPMSDAHAKMLGVTPIVRDLENVVETEPVIRAQWVVPSQALPIALECQPEGVQFGIASGSDQDDSVFASVTKKGVSKGSAVLALCETLKIDPRNVMAVGDSTGDVPMFDVVGHPYAMLNGVDEIKDKYPVSSKSVEEFGVIDLIDIAMELSPEES